MAKKTYTFKADEKEMEAVRDKIEKENKKVKDWRLRKTLSSKINELLYDYVTR